ncbi:hypothetical protein IQ273_25530, partial [Nodosilinea sp. LEGE 07298]|nr:hypothetical protein [Nodosilinea sp. LEGE 07298]
MATSPFLTSFVRHRDPRLLWPVAGIASVVAHGVALVMVRSLAIQTPALPEGEMAPMPIQLLTLPADLPTSGEPSANIPSDATSTNNAASAEPAVDAVPAPVADQPTPVAPTDTAPSDRPPLEPFITSTPPQTIAPPVV